jgi:RimJ/RimL family protein N-acetyltransferase
MLRRSVDSSTVQAQRAKPARAKRHRKLSLRFCPCTVQYWEFVSALRSDPRVQRGFITRARITPKQQRRYMRAHWRNYFVALVNEEPAGFVGSVDGDIRVCTHPDYQSRGIATFMITELMRRFPSSFAKVKIDNEASKRLFAACGFAPSYIVYERQRTGRSLGGLLPRQWIG